MRLSLVLSAAVTLAGSLGAAVPTFNRDIAPILYQNCATCHRPGEVAPFSLLTYQDAAKRARLIAAVTHSRVMPPWKPEPGYGSFANERRLSESQIALIQAWAKAGAPEGDPKHQPMVPVFPVGWQAGEPDKILGMLHKFDVPADGPDVYRCFVLPSGLDQDTYVGGIEFRPGNPRVVHHALIFLDARGKAHERAAGSPDGGYPCFGGPGFIPSGSLGGWAPGATPPPMSAEIAQRVKAGSDIVVQIHYHPSGKPEQDQSRLGLRFSGPPSKGRAGIMIASRGIDIPAGDANYVVRASVVMPQDGDLIGITPHAHYLGKDMKANAYLPDGSTKPLIWIKDWDFNWQGQYRYATPVHLPKGTRIEFEYSYDNSEANPHNPTHPPKRVTWGEQTTDEMAILFLSVTLPSPADVPAFQRDVRQQLVRSILQSSFTRWWNGGQTAN